MNEDYSSGVHTFFAILSNLEQRFGRKKLKLTILSPTRENDNGYPHRQVTKWRVHLLDYELLPELLSVQTLCFEDEYTGDGWNSETMVGKIGLGVLAKIASKCPRLEILTCMMETGMGWTGNAKKELENIYRFDWVGPLRDSRHNFAKSLETTTLPQTLREVSLNFIGQEPEIPFRVDQRAILPNLISPAQFDIFSSSLRVLSQQLRRMMLWVIADDTLFWPRNGATSWPNLETLSVQFQLSCPSGQWYFEGDDGRRHVGPNHDINGMAYPPLVDLPGDAQLDHQYHSQDVAMGSPMFSGDGRERGTLFRTAPNNNLLVPFLSAFTKAAAHMPVLKEALIWTQLGYNSGDEYDDDQMPPIFCFEDTMGWGIAYAAPGMRCSFPVGAKKNDPDARQIWWLTGKWRPTKELRRLFQHIGDRNVRLMEYLELDQHFPGRVLANSFFYEWESDRDFHIEGRNV